MFENIKRIFKPETPKTENPPSGEVGIAYSGIYYSDAFQRYNPDDLILKRGNAVYKNMMRDDQVKASLELKKHAVISRKWFFDVPVDEDSGEPDPQQQEMADYFTFMVEAVAGSWTAKLRAMMSAFANGFSISEIMFMPLMYDGKTMWGVSDLKLRPFDTIHFIADEHGNLVKVKQGTFGTEIELPTNKIIHFVYQGDVDRHYGESDLRAAYRSYWSKDICIKFYNIALERYGSGFPIAKVTEGKLPPAQMDKLQDIMKNISARTGLVIPSNVDFQMITPSTTTEFQNAWVMHDKAIAKSVLVPNMMGLSEQGDKGGYSQSQTQLEAFFWVLDEIARGLQETINDQLFRPLALWNFNADEFPRYTFEPISDAKKIEIARAWNEMVGKSVDKTEADEAWIRRFLGAPDKPEDEEDEETPPGDGEENPDDLLPEDEPDEDWIPANGNKEFKALFADKPWMRRVNFSRIEKSFNDHEAVFGQEIADIMAAVRVSIEKQIEKIIGERSAGNVNPKEFEAVKIPSGLMGSYRKAVKGNLKRVLDEGYETAAKELPKKAFRTTNRVGMDKTQADKYLMSRAMQIAAVMEKDVLDAVQLVLANALKYDKTLKQTIDALMEDTTLLQALPEVDAAGRAVNVPARLENIVRTNTADALNQGRQSLFGSSDMKGFVVAFEYSAILDDRVTEVCAALDGKIRKDWGERTPPNHYQCRSILVPVTVIDDWNGKEDRIPAAGTPQKGFV